MAHYVKCPRCELNYIDSDRQQYCDVCILEMKGLKTESEELEEEEESELQTELCPVCGSNMMHAGEEMCEECRRKTEDEQEPDPEEDDEWRNYLEADAGSDLDSEMDELDESMESEFADEIEEEEEEEEFVDEEEDLDYVTGDEIYTLVGDDDDDDDDDRADEDDF